jgi:diaminohydroxyphosphoribosylaminopyrimidine deaminase/5-amino-6-(5-phosphoribosylamino)uracil reductase
VVFPIEDPNPKVNGKGMEHLRLAGVDVSVGLMGREAARLNEKYLYFMQTGRPFVHLKMATSLDGKIATRTGDSRWITGAESRQRVHELRHEYDAILVGAGTACSDDPLLTDRSGKPRRNPLVRVVLDDALKISPDSKIVTSVNESPVIVFAGESVESSSAEQLQARGVEVLRGDARNLEAVLDELGRRSIQSVLVEGGAAVAGGLRDAGLINKVSFFIAPLIIGGREARAAVAGEGAETLAQALELEDVDVITHGRDLEVTGYPKRRNEG